MFMGVVRVYCVCVYSVNIQILYVCLFVDVCMTVCCVFTVCPAARGAVCVVMLLKILCRFVDNGMWGGC